MASPAAASVDSITDPATAYVAARAASISGDHAEAANIYARLASGSNDTDLRQAAISEAISAGDMDQALRLSEQMPPTERSLYSRLLLVSDALKRGDDAEAVKLLGKSGAKSDLSFWSPLVEAWDLAERRDSAGSLAALSKVPRTSALASFVDEESALILLKLGKTVQAQPYARLAVERAGARKLRVRLAFAAGFEAAGDRAGAQGLIAGVPGFSPALSEELDSGRLKTMIIDTSAKAFSEQLIALALEMEHSQNSPDTPLYIARIACFAAPGNDSATILLATLLTEQDRFDDALAALRSVAPDSPLSSEALDAQARALIDSKRFDEALALATKDIRNRDSTSDDFARLGDVYAAMKRPGEAADAYGHALERSADAGASARWPLLLLEANSLQSAGRWPEAKAALEAAIALAPNQPLILNFLGYATLQHGENLNTAEALIRKASELAPDNASITDSLGWALYKRGRTDEAITVLQKAAVGDPAQSDIQEHLGDALYSAGLRFEARFAWQAALATADPEDMARLHSKIESGLERATEAP